MYIQGQIIPDLTILLGKKNQDMAWHWLPWDSVNFSLYSVFYLAGEFARHLQRQAQDDFPSKRETLFTNGEVICAEIAGLCHDLGE